jgi:hypothetical protein
MNTSGSYSNLFKKKHNPSNISKSNINVNGQHQDISNSFRSDQMVLGEYVNHLNGNDYKFNTKYIETANPDYKVVPVGRIPLSTPKPPLATKKSIPNKKQREKSFDLTRIQQDKCLSPKSNFKFDNELLSRCASSDKLSWDGKSIKSGSVEDDTGYSSVHYYLQRRHTEAQSKLLRLKEEQLRKENEHMRDRPKISKNSKRIVDNLRENRMNVFDRLTSPHHQSKKMEEITNLKELNDKTVGKPKVKFMII